MKYILVVEDQVVSCHSTLESAQKEAADENDLENDDIEIFVVSQIYIPRTTKTRWVLKE